MADGEATVDGDAYPVRMEAFIQFELSDDAGGAQPVKTLWRDCELWVDSEYEEKPCSYGDGWEWDGADELSHRDECDLVVTR